nr:ribosome silencing factor [Anaeromonas gelatinilytica]
MIIDTADDKRAVDIEVIEVSEITSIADFFVICSGNSERQTIAIADAIDEKMYENGYELKSKEGHRSGRWILLDFGDIIVHIFHKEDRVFYNLERLWIDGKKVDVDNYVD